MGFLKKKPLEERLRNRGIQLLPEDASVQETKNAMMENPSSSSKSDALTHLRQVRNIACLQKTTAIVANEGETVLVHTEPLWQRVASKIAGVFGLQGPKVKDEIVAAYSGETADRKPHYGRVEVIENPQPAIVIDSETDYESGDNKPLAVKLYINLVLDFCQGTSIESQEIRSDLANYYKFEFNDHNEWLEEVRTEISKKLEYLIHKNLPTRSDKVEDKVKKEVETSLVKFLKGEMEINGEGKMSGACAIVRISKNSSVKLVQLDLPSSEKEEISKLAAKEREELRMAEVMKQNISTVLTGDQSVKDFVKEMSTDGEGNYDPIAGHRFLSTATAIGKATMSGQGDSGSIEVDSRSYPRKKK